MGTGIPFSDHPSPPPQPSAKDAGSGFLRPLSFGERKALEMQAANRQAVNQTPAEFEARNRRSIATDMAAKAPRVFVTGNVIR
jgi:hypothetical protein